MADKLFSNLLIVDCASFIAGPAAATIFADFGARVIKIEPPKGGDGYRLLKQLPGMPRSDSNYPWTLTNRSKESLAIDLKSEEGREILEKLLERADVFITNYPLGVRERLRLNYSDLQPLNPRLIYGSLTPYGEEGPEAGNTGYDATAWWARSGLMDSVRADADSPPQLSVPGMGDHMAANMLYGAIVTALYRREQTGQGGAVGTSLMANGIWSNGLYVQAALDGADTQLKKGGGKHNAFVRTYRCADDRWFILTLLPQAQEKGWPQLARCLGHEEWVQDERFVDADARKENNLALADLLSQGFALQDWDYWSRELANSGITCGRIARASDHGEDVQAREAGVITDVEGGSGARTIDSPLYISGETKRSPQPPPGLGEHTLAILAELGFESEIVKTLQDNGVVGTPQ